MSMRSESNDGGRASSRAAVGAEHGPRRMAKLHCSASDSQLQRARTRALPVLGLIVVLMTASFTYAESKNDAKKSYDAVVTKASRDLTDGKIDEATKDEPEGKAAWARALLLAAAKKRIEKSKTNRTPNNPT